MSDYILTTGAVCRQFDKSASWVLWRHRIGDLDAIRDSTGRRLFSASSVQRFADVFARSRRSSAAA